MDLDFHNKATVKSFEDIVKCLLCANRLFGKMKARVRRYGLILSIHMFFPFLALSFRFEVDLGLWLPLLIIIKSNHYYHIR